MSATHYDIHLVYKSYNTEVLNNHIKQLVKHLSKLNLNPKVSSMPTKINKFTVLRSPHIDKKARDQFELRTHSKLLVFKKLAFKNMKRLGSLVHSYNTPGLGNKIIIYHNYNHKS
jgi:small subunit ribosomal protein S10